MKYKLRNYCRDCFNTDFQGCFDGDYSYLHEEEASCILTDNIYYKFNSPIYKTEDINILHKLGKKIHRSCGLYEYQILDEEDNIVFDSY